MPTCNIDDYGASPSGSGDSSPALVAAVDAAGLGGTVLASPGGVYLFRNHAEIRAEGANADEK